MWTIVWIDENDVDHYERCEFSDEVMQVLKDNNLDADINVLIFPPDTELDPMEFMQTYGSK